MLSMDFREANVGMEVVHSELGRGNVIEKHPESEDSIADVSVYFYRTREQTDVPVYDVEPAANVTSIESKAGSLGLHVTIDDGFFRLYIEPDGNRTGYSVSLHAGNALIDELQLSAEAFL